MGQPPVEPGHGAENKPFLVFGHRDFHRAHRDETIFVHQVAYLVDAGYDGMMAASIVGLVGFLSVGSKVLWGWSADTIGREMTYTWDVPAWFWPLVYWP